MKTFTDQELDEIRMADKYENGGHITPEDLKYVSALDHEVKMLMRSYGMTVKKPNKNTVKNIEARIKIVKLLQENHTVQEITKLAKCSRSLVYTVKDELKRQEG